MGLEYIIANLIKEKSFQKLKKIIENNAWHDNESAYKHSIRTTKIAKREVKGKFIKNTKARELYFHFINSPIEGMKRSDILILTVLLHDIGKSLSYKEGGQTKSILITLPDGTTVCPGHQYYGSKLAEKLLSSLGFSKNLTQ